MITPDKRLERVRAHRKYQPSAIGNSLFMLLVRYASLAGFLILGAMSIYIYASAGHEIPESKRTIDRSVMWLKEDLMRLHEKYSIDQAYLLMIIAVMFLGVYKLTTMVLRRNDYIFTLNEVMDSEE